MHKGDQRIILLFIRGGASKKANHNLPTEEVSGNHYAKRVHICFLAVLKKWHIIRQDVASFIFFCFCMEMENTNRMYFKNKICKLCFFRILLFPAATQNFAATNFLTIDNHQKSHFGAKCKLTSLCLFLSIPYYAEKLFLA